MKFHLSHSSATLEEATFGQLLESEKMFTLTPRKMDSLLIIGAEESRREHGAKIWLFFFSKKLSLLIFHARAAPFINPLMTVRL